MANRLPAGRVPGRMRRGEAGRHFGHAVCSEAFILGMDASIVPSLEAGGVRYYDFDGKEKDVFEILSENGINYIRVRVWVDPYDGSGRGYGGGNCDIGTALAIGKRRKGRCPEPLHHGLPSAAEGRQGGRRHGAAGQ